MRTDTPIQRQVRFRAPGEGAILEDPQPVRSSMNEDIDGPGEYIGGVWVPADPMDMLQCESCQ